MLFPDGAVGGENDLYIHSLYILPAQAVFFSSAYSFSLYIFSGIFEEFVSVPMYMAPQQTPPLPPHHS